MPSACHVQAVAGHGNVLQPSASTARTVLAIIGNRSKLEVSGAFVPNVWMRDKVAYGKGVVVVHHHVLMRKPTKAAMSSNGQSTA